MRYQCYLDRDMSELKWNERDYPEEPAGHFARVFVRERYK